MWSRVSERARVCTRAAAFAYCTQNSGSNTTSSLNSNTAEWSSAASLELYREHLFFTVYSVPPKPLRSAPAI